MSRAATLKNYGFAFQEIQKKYINKFGESKTLRIISYLGITLTILVFILTISIYLPKLYSNKFEGWVTPSALNADCYDNNTGIKTICNIHILPLNDGRYRIDVEDFSNKTLTLNADFNSNNINYFVLRQGISNDNQPLANNLVISAENKTLNITTNLDNENTHQRVELPLFSQTNIHKSIQIKDISHQLSTHGLILDEIGFSSRSTQNIVNHRYIKKYHKIKKINIILAELSCLAFLLISLNKSSTNYKDITLLIFFTFFLIFSTNILQLWESFSPLVHQDLRIYNASGTMQAGIGSEFNYGAYMVLNIITGHGPVMNPHYPPWERMPGYGFVLSVMTIFMSKPINLLDILINSIFFQIFLFAAAASYFAYTASKITKCWIIALAIILIRYYSFAPNTQIEGIMPAVILFILGNNCLFINKIQQNKVPSFMYHLLLHFGFLLWFLIRADIVPAWMIISIILYARPLKNLKYMLIPTLMLLTSGLTWALWKQQYTHEFSMTTNSIGASFMVGLWEIPHKFIWQVSDGTYFDWIQNTFKISAMSKHASNIAMHQVLRFYLTYPFYMVTLVWHKFMLYVTQQSNVQYTLVFLFIIITSIMLNYKRLQTLLLAWPILFNVPVFFLSYSGGGRFYFAPAISLIITSTFLIFDTGYYRRIQQLPVRFIILLLIFILIAYKGMTLDNYLIHNNKFRYATPFLNPAKSTLNICANNKSC